MIRVIAILPPGSWQDKPIDSITLDHDQRHRRRIRLVSDTGIEFMLHEPDAVRLADGCGLRLEDGRVVQVRAAPEALLEVRGKDAAALLRLAWHIGNRHLPAQIVADGILIQQDHVIAAMLEGLGASCRPVVAPFEPEGGAYDAHH